ncbi:MAG: hypothetical protein NZL87_08260, partial [Thermomicrobium sp.]|nr:hypothetical protein [Thermomicrobium sp.]
HRAQSPAPHRETLAQRLARAATPIDQHVRQVLEAWFARLPAVAQTDVRSRFWERDRRLALSAFWELYLHEFLTRLGYEPTPHPALAASGPRPDFLARCEDESLYVEALIHGPPTEAWRAERRLYPILDVLHDLSQPPVVLELVRVEFGHSTPPLRELRTTLADWLASFDPASDEERLEWRRKGWTVEVRVRRTPVAEILPATPDQVAAPSLRTLATKLLAKARRYRALDSPLLLALCTTHRLPEPTLIGELASVVQALPQSVVGVLVASGLDPWSIASTPLFLFRRTPETPLPAAVLATFERLGVRSLAPMVSCLDEPWNLFDLWPTWPETPDSDGPSP